MKPLIDLLRQNPILWMLIFVPVVLVAETIASASHTLLFVLAVLAIVPLAALLSHATESVAEKTGDAIGGLFNATIFVSSVQKARETLGISPAFVGFIIVALVGAAAEMAVAFSAARRNRLDMSVSIALGSASQIALFEAPVLVLLSYFVGPTPMHLQFWPGAVTMVMISTVTATFVTNSGLSAWFIGALLLFIYAIFAMTLYMVPPGSQGAV